MNSLGSVVAWIVAGGLFVCDGPLTPVNTAAAASLQCVHATVYKFVQMWFYPSRS